MKKLTFNEEPQEKVFDRNGKEIEIGSHVIWFDPEIDARDIDRVWTVDDYTNDIVQISDEYSEAEVYPSEIEIVD
jgi:hypothetical protein